MKLIYRGIKYLSRKSKVRVKPPESAIAQKYRLSSSPDSNKVMLIRPIQYYTYRGVSYTKSLVFDTKTIVLLDLDRQ